MIRIRTRFAAVLLLPVGVAAAAASSTAAAPGEAHASVAPTSAPAGDAATLRAVRDATLEPVRRTEALDPRVPFDAGRAPFRLEVGGEPVLHRVMAVAVLPGESVEIRVTDPAAGASFRYAAGSAEPRAGGWSWTAPDRPGIHSARVVSATGDAVTLNLLVAHPATEVRGGELNGYAIGRYVEKPLRGNPAYLPPTGFVEVRANDRDVLVSPHFTLGQLLCKQPGEPRYISYSAPLVRKLETVLERLNEKGVRAPTLHVMSGFRTPAYNRAIGNNTVYSRHLWGDAADVFVDVDRDGYMDDLNGDGRADLGDARLLADVVDELAAEGAEGVEPGGMGLYRRNAVRGPFVHVDARGHRARW